MSDYPIGSGWPKPIETPADEGAVVERQGDTMNKWPDPPPELLSDPKFLAIWETIKTWDVAVPSQYGGYCGATGNHVYAIYRAALLAEADGELK